MQQGQFRPVYFLYGEESYFIDRVARYIEEHALGEAERSFNQTILYGKDTDARTVIDVASRYPMMAPRQVVILKEAQEMRSLKDLKEYVEKPVETTVLVICHKHKRFDGRTAFAKTLKKKAVVLESKRLYDNQVPGWIQQFIQKRGHTIQEEAPTLLAEYLGTDLSRIANELEKLFLHLSDQSHITIDLVQEHIGISKDYNVFELQKAIGLRQVSKAHRIVAYAAANPKSMPLIMVMGVLYNYFTKVMQLQQLRNSPEKELLQALRLRSGFFLREYRQAARHYPWTVLPQVFALLHEYDLKAKGLGQQDTPEEELLKELVNRLLFVASELQVQA